MAAHRAADIARIDDSYLELGASGELNKSAAIEFGEGKHKSSYGLAFRMH